jgi:UDP-N-acetylglucosamine acyltransferase
MKRRGFTQEKINEIQEMYRIIYHRGLNNTQARELLEKDFTPSVERDEIIGFMRASKRGLIRGPNSPEEI